MKRKIKGEECVTPEQRTISCNELSLALAIVELQKLMGRLKLDKIEVYPCSANVHWDTLPF